MILAQISESVIAAVSTGIAAILAVGIPAWIALQRAWQEIAERKAAAAKLDRNGVIEEWKAVTDLQGKRIDGLMKEVESLRLQVTNLYTENSQLRGLITAKDRRVEGQATQVEKLQTQVTLMKDAVPVLKVPDGSTVTIPEAK